MSTAPKLYRLPGALGNIGLISPVNAHFCGDCNRIRLTADGKVKPCLHSNVEYALKGWTLRVCAVNWKRPSGTSLRGMGIWMPFIASRRGET